MTFWELVTRPKSKPSEDSSSSSCDVDKLADPTSSLLSLPTEIIDEILTYLPCPSLVSLSRTCKRLKTQAENDLLWLSHVRENLPELPDSPSPLDSYRSLYISHHPYWFLTRYKIWFSDEPYTGKIIICKYDARRGCIEGYRLVAERWHHDFQAWSHLPNVIIHSFTPEVKLHTGNPVLRLDQFDQATLKKRQGWWDGEIRMSAAPPVYSTFFLSRDIPERLQDPRMELWPPRTIPNMPRVRNASQEHFQGSGHKPQKYDEICQTSFRIRTWTQFSVAGSAFGVRMGEEVSTWSTLEPELYTPTKEKPYQGIYVGDFSGHGCEFILVMQTEKAPEPRRPRAESRYYDASALPQEVTSIPMAQDDASESGPSAKAPTKGENASLYEENSIYTGAIEAIKLTGDPNVPRGEHTFIADDIGPAGFIRIAHEQPFRGARIVKSRGHVAGRGFRADEFIPTQLIMMSHNKLAQYWAPFGHISFFERIDLDQLLPVASERTAV